MRYVDGALTNGKMWLPHKQDVNPGSEVVCIVKLSKVDTVTNKYIFNKLHHSCGKSVFLTS